MIHDKAYRLIQLDEGKRNFVYPDTLGYHTIGYGRNIDQRGGRGLSDSEILFLLDNDISAAIFDLIEIFPNWGDIDASRQAALISLHHNLGPIKFRGFHNFIVAVMDNDWDRAADQLVNSKWYGQVGNRGPRLVRIVRTGEFLLT